MVRHPKLVIAIPTYNEERYLSRTIKSLTAQTWEDFAVIISDNCSTDTTADIAQDIAARDVRFHCHQHERNIGAVGNFNYARRVTESQFFMWLGGHDMLHPEFIARHLAALSNDQQLSLSYSFTGWIDEEDVICRVSTASDLGLIRGSDMTRYLASAQRINECTAINNVIRRSYLEGASFETVAAADHIVLSHLLYCGPFHYIAEPLYLRREPPATREDYMQRLTGQQNQARDLTVLIPHYLADFDKLTGQRWSRLWARPTLRLILKARFGADRKSFISRAVNKVVKTLFTALFRIRGSRDFPSRRSYHR